MPQEAPSPAQETLKPAQTSKSDDSYEDRALRAQKAATVARIEHFGPSGTATKSDDSYEDRAFRA